MTRKIQVVIAPLIAAIALLASGASTQAHLNPHHGRATVLFPLAKQASGAHQVGAPYCGGYQPPGPGRPPAGPPPPNPGPPPPNGGPYPAITAPASVAVGSGSFNPTPSVGQVGNFPPGMGPGLPQNVLPIPYGRVGCLAVWTDSLRYPGFNIPVYACYTVPGPWLTEVDLWHFNGGFGFNAYYGYDDGTGGCGLLGFTGGDYGWRAFSIKVWGPDGNEYTATTYYYVG